jgi:SAM-dependent methyltransferase
MLKTASAILAGALLGITALLVWQNNRPETPRAEPVTANPETAKANPETTKAPCPQSKPSPLATKYLENLHGIEIGASRQNSFALKRSVNVDFSDEQGGLWQDKSCEPTAVNIVAFGDDLPFKDNTLDYVLTSHVIEHFFDPVKALREWHRVIKPGGYIFIIAPHKDRTFDKPREVTPPAELLDRSMGRIRISDYVRGVDIPALTTSGKAKFGPDYEVPPQMLLRRGVQPEEGWVRYNADDHHHWSVWRTNDLADLVKALRFTIVETQDTDDKVGNGFTLVIKK